MQTRKKPAVYFKTFFEAYLVIVKTTSCKNFISYDYYAYVYKKNIGCKKGMRAI